MKKLNIKKTILCLSLLGLMAIPTATNAHSMDDHGLETSGQLWGYAYTYSNSSWAYTRINSYCVYSDDDDAEDYSETGNSITTSIGGWDCYQLKGKHQTDDYYTTSKG